MNFPVEIDLFDIRRGDKIELTSIKEGTVAVGVVQTPPTIGSDYSSIRFTSEMTLYFYSKETTFRLLGRIPENPKVGQIIPRAAYITLPSGSVVDDGGLGLLSITQSSTGKKRIRRVMDHNFSWPSLSHKDVKGCIQYLPPKGDIWLTWDKEGWRQANGS